MDEPTLSKPNTSSQLVLPQSQTDRLDQPQTKLPPELIRLIIELCSRKDQKTFCLLSYSSRQLAIPFLFRRATFLQCEAPVTIERLNEMRGDIKAAIKVLILGSRGYGNWSFTPILSFLRNLPNLQIFVWSVFSRCDQGFHQLVDSLQHCPLEHFAYWGCPSLSEPMTAPPRLKSLFIRDFRISQRQLYDFVQPSFSTLVELEIHSETFHDLLPLRPAGGTLRKFYYGGRFLHSDTPGESLLDAIPVAFPHLTTLALEITGTPPDIRWKSSYDGCIAKNTKLQDLSVRAIRFVFCDGNPSIPHKSCKRCGRERMEATRTLAIACTGLKHCQWEHPYAQYGFNIRLSRKSLLQENALVVRVKSTAFRKVVSLFDRH